MLFFGGLQLIEMNNWVFRKKYRKGIFMSQAKSAFDQGDSFPFVAAEARQVKRVYISMSSMASGFRGSCSMVLNATRTLA